MLSADTSTLLMDAQDQSVHLSMSNRHSNPCFKRSQFLIYKRLKKKLLNRMKNKLLKIQISKKQFKRRSLFLETTPSLKGCLANQSFRVQLKAFLRKNQLQAEVSFQNPQTRLYQKSLKRKPQNPKPLRSLRN